MSAKTQLFEDELYNTQPKDLRVTDYDTTHKGTRYRVQSKNVRAHAGYFYVSDDMVVTPDMPTRAAFPRHFVRVSKAAILNHIRETEHEEQRYAYRVTTVDGDHLVWGDDSAAVARDDPYVDDVTIISW